MLHGSEENTKLYREKFGIKTAYRVTTRSISSYDELPSMEFEEIIVETNAMSREDFFRIRFFQFLFSIFTSEIFLELSHGLYINGSDYVTLIEMIAEDKENWTPKIKKFFNDFKQAAKDELTDDPKLEFLLEDIKEARINCKSLNPFFMCKLVTNTELISDFKLYLLEFLNRFLGSQITPINLNDLKQTVRFAFDKMVNYEKIGSEKILLYNYDISSWLDNTEKLPLEKFYIPEPIEYIFKLDDNILSYLEEVKSYSDDFAEAVYRLRTNVLGPTGDKIFCYRRIPLVNQENEYNKISRREAIRRHAEVFQKAT